MSCDSLVVSQIGCVELSDFMIDNKFTLKNLEVRGGGLNCDCIEHPEAFSSLESLSLHEVSLTGPFLSIFPSLKKVRLVDNTYPDDFAYPIPLRTLKGFAKIYPNFEYLDHFTCTSIKLRFRGFKGCNTFNLTATSFLTQTYPK